MSLDPEVKWKYKNLTIAGLGVLLALILSRIEVLHDFLIHLGGFGYIGAFIAGIFFVSTFTVSTSILVLFTLAETMSPLEIGLIAGVGAVVGDLLIFNFFKDNLAGEISDIFHQVDRKKRIKKLFHSKYFNWMLPVFGAAIIASPLPDELGISLLGMTKVSKYRFIALSYVLNSAGIFVVVSASSLVNIGSKL